MTVGHNSGDPDVIRIYWDESVWCLLPIYSQFEQPRYDQVTVSICCQSALRCLSGYFLLPSGSDKKDVYHCFFALREDKTTRRHVREMKGTKATTHTGVRRKKNKRKHLRSIQGKVRDCDEDFTLLDEGSPESSLSHTHADSPSSLSSYK